MLEADMTTEINKKRGRPSEPSEEARAKGGKGGKNSWGVGEATVSPSNEVQGQSPWRGLGRSSKKIGIFEVYNCQKRNFLAGNAGHSRQIDT